MSKVVQAVGRVLRVLSWSPSRLGKWKECPAKVKYEDLLKMCPACFKGRVSGGFDGKPVVCDTCSDPQPEREALDRGNMLDEALTKMVGKEISVPVDYHINRSESEQPAAAAVRHPVIAALVKSLRKAKGVHAQHSITLGRDWKTRFENPSKKIFAKDAWGRVKLDILRVTGSVAEVIDWKSGNIDKNKMEIRERPEYHDSMRAYQIAVLAADPKLKEARARMAFIDAPPKLENPFKEPHTGTLKRSELELAQRQWEQKVEPMMSDVVFAPRPGFYCSWCPFSKRKGGPCPH